MVQLVRGASSQLRPSPAMMPGHLAVRSVARCAVLRRHCRAGVRHRGRWHSRGCHRRSRRRGRRSCRRARAGAVGRQSRSTGVRTRHAHRIAAGRIGWLRPNRRRERERGDHRHTGQKIFHVCDPLSRVLNWRLSVGRLVWLPSWVGFSLPGLHMVFATASVEWAAITDRWTVEGPATGSLVRERARARGAAWNHPTAGARVPAG